jgi:hypothetical protein
VTEQLTRADSTKTPREDAPMQPISNGRQEVVVIDIKMPFWSMVVFMIKWALASIPAVFILYVIAAALFMITTMIISR